MRPTQTSHPARPPFRALRRAFTLLEILVVLAIIGMLVGLAVGNFGGIINSRSISIAQLFLQTTSKAPLLAYRMDNGDFPSTTEGLQALLTPAPGKETSWKAPYLDTPNGGVPLDPWKHAYQYKYPGTHSSATGYDLWSVGPDGLDGTPDDIGNWPAVLASQ